jgi:hypothetical protein
MAHQNCYPQLIGFHEHTSKTILSTYIKPTTDRLGFEEDRYQTNKFVIEEWIHVGKHPSDGSCTPSTATFMADST